MQRLSTYNAQRKEKQRQKLDSTEKFPEPWEGFQNDAKKLLQQILVSHKKNNKTLTKNKKGFSVRGQLHKENVFGKRQAPNQEPGFHRRKKITEITDHKLVDKIVDVTIQNLIRNYLREKFNINVGDPKGYKIPKEAFFKDGKWQVYLPNKKGDNIPIKKVRVKEVLNNAAQLKSDLNQFVNPRNNHHVLIYEDKEGNLKEVVVQFWTVIERKLQEVEIYQIPSDGKLIITILEISDMFLLRLSDEEYEINKNNKEYLSRYLYKVEAISSKYYEFRHHLESSQKREFEPYYYIISSLGTGKKGLQTFNPIKVKIDPLGNIQKQ